MSLHDKYLAWIKAQLDASDSLNQTGLAKAMGLERSQVSLMVLGRRAIKLSEIDAIEGYLGKTWLSRLPQTSNVSGGVAIAGRVGMTWTETGETIQSTRTIAPVLDQRYPATAQEAYEVELAYPELGILPGDIVIVAKGAAWLPGQKLVTIKTRRGFQAFGLATVQRSGKIAAEDGQPVGLVIEVRRSVA